MRLSILLAFLLAAFSAKAQSSFTGDWTGALQAGITLHLDFHITQDGDTLAAVMDSPDQGVKGIKCGKVTVNGDSITILIPRIYGYYKGALKNDVISGVWQQLNKSLPLELKRGTVGVADRPQTPKPPFGYKSEDIIYYNADSSQRFGATITIPNGKGPFPAVLLITGSGLQNRDEEILRHKPFAVIADYLTKRGYVVMRVDDRGVGQSTGDVVHATTVDFAKDVNVSLDYLKKRKEVNTKKMGLLGHSEGGMIAPMVANERKDVAFIVLLAGPAVPMTQLVADQAASVMKSKGISDTAIAACKQLYGILENVILTNQDTARLTQELANKIGEWQKQTPPEVAEAAIGVHDDSTRDRLASAFAEQASNDWFRYFLSINPQTYLPKLHCKVLALNGEKDIQVLAAANVPAMREALAKSHAKEYEVRELSGLNHLFQHCDKCTVNEYGELQETFSPDALKIIGDWLDKEVK